MSIESDTLAAQNCATEISSSGAGLLSVNLASKDSTTTIIGNGDAHNAITLDETIAGQVATTVNSFVNLIHSTANTFESTDKRLSQMLATGARGSNSSGTSFQPNQCLFGG